MSFIHKAVVAAMGLLAVASASQGASLGLTSGLPDIYTDTMAVNYQSDVFTALSPNDRYLSIVTSTTHYDTDGVGLFNLVANIDSAGTLIDGTITITGSLYDIDAGAYVVDDSSNVLLTGDLTELGYTVNGDGALFEFKFETTGGYLKTNLGFPDIGGIILTANASNFQSFADVITNADGVADTIGLPAVPTPASWTGGMALAGMLVVARVRSRRMASI